MTAVWMTLRLASSAAPRASCTLSLRSPVGRHISKSGSALPGLAAIASPASPATSAAARRPPLRRSS
eukprot:11163176-Lingulodinium_polyedra.AAC.1